MKDNQLLSDDKWISIYVQKPEQGQLCIIKTKGEQGYASGCVYNNGNFETYSDQRNRFIITIWKNDLWIPEKQGKKIDNYD